MTGGAGMGVHAVLRRCRLPACPLFAPVVSGRGNDLLLLQNRAADRAPSALGQSGLGTGRLDARDGRFGVSLRRYNGLFDEYRAAVFTVASLRQTVFGAGRLDGRINYFFMFELVERNGFGIGIGFSLGFNRGGVGDRAFGCTGRLNGYRGVRACLRQNTVRKYRIAG